MNQSGARATKHFEGWIGEFRLRWKADWIVVTEKGEPKIFATEEKAELAAWRAWHKIDEPEMVRCGLIVTKKDVDRMKANAIFQNGRKIPVERKAERMAR